MKKIGIGSVKRPPTTIENCCLNFQPKSAFWYVRIEYEIVERLKEAMKRRNWIRTLHFSRLSWKSGIFYNEHISFISKKR
jgi:hypothetical protein